MTRANEGLPYATDAASSLERGTDASRAFLSSL